MKEEALVTALNELDLKQTEKLLDNHMKEIRVKIGRRSRSRIEKSVFEKIGKGDSAPNPNAALKKQTPCNRIAWQLMPLAMALLLITGVGAVGLYLAINQDDRYGVSESPEMYAAEEPNITDKDCLLNEIVILPEGDYDEERVREHIESIKILDLKFLQAMYLKGSKIVFVNERYSTVPALDEKWDNHNINAAYVLIKDMSVYEGEKDYDVFYAGEKHFERLALFRGIGHIIDIHLSGGAFSANPELNAIAEEEWVIFTENPIPFPPVPDSFTNWEAGGLQTDFSVEYFASVFEIYYIEDNLGCDFLREYAPLTFAYLEKIVYDSYTDEFGNIQL